MLSDPEVIGTPPYATLRRLSRYALLEFAAVVAVSAIHAIRYYHREDVR